MGEEQAILIFPTLQHQMWIRHEAIYKQILLIKSRMSHQINDIYTNIDHRDITQFTMPNMRQDSKPYDPFEKSCLASSFLL